MFVEMPERRNWMDRKVIVELLAEGLSVDAIGKRVGKHRETVAYWMAKYGLEAPNREKHAAKGGIARQRLESLVADRLSIAEIGQEVGLSKTSVRYWLGRYGLRTHSAARTATVQGARESGVRVVRMGCPQHGDADFVLEGRGYYRCTACRQERVTQRRREVKATLVAEAGGRCAVCGYDRCIRALQFHHLEPSNKRHTVCNDGRMIAIAALRAEAQKCLVLCANCHAEVEAGATMLPLEFASGELGPTRTDGREAPIRRYTTIRGSSMAERTAVNR